MGISDDIRRGQSLLGGGRGHPEAPINAEPTPLAPRIGLLVAGLDIVDLTVRAILVLVMLGELTLILVEILQRGLFNASFLWSEEISRIAILTITFCGGALAFRARSNTSVEAVSARLPPAARRAIEAFLDQLILIVSLLCVSGALDLYDIGSLSVMPVLLWSQSWLEVPFIVGLTLMSAFALERLLVRHTLRTNLSAAPASALFAVLLYAGLGRELLHFGNESALVIMLVAFFAAILLGLPVGFAMLAGSLLFLALTDMAPLIAVAQNTIDGSGHFILLTLPFFIWAGMIMEEGEISVRLVRFAMTVVGHLRGGLLQVVVVTTYLVSGVSGSKIADVVAVGSVMREELRRKNYRLEEGAAVLAASAAMSETIPPSIGMLVLGSVVPVSIGKMFIAGLLPAAVLAIFIMGLVYIMARRQGIPTLPRAGARLLMSEGLNAILPLLMPVILIVGIKLGVATPTEVSSVAVLYGLVLSVAIYRSIGVTALIRIATRCAVMSGMVLFIIAAAGSFSWVLAAGNLPLHLVAFLHAAGDNKLLFLAGSVLIMIVVGSLLEGLPALVILAPILYPIAGQLGIDGIHYAILMLLAMGVGIFMPPVGIGFHVCCSIMNTSVEKTSWAIVPYLMVLLFGIALLAIFPEITHIALYATE
jgi:tripartite ATP-independent transporter DctM subunit